MKLAWVLGNVGVTIFMNERECGKCVRDKSREIFYESSGGVMEPPADLSGQCSEWVDRLNEFKRCIGFWNTHTHTLILERTRSTKNEEEFDKEQ
jgi:hypothetical protein